MGRAPIGRLRLDAALLLAGLANRAYSVALVVSVYDATHSSTWVAAAAGARYLPGVVTGELAGRLLDRLAPRLVLVWADVCCALSLAAMATAVLQDTSPVVPIALAAVVRICASGQPPAAAGMLPAVAGGRDLSHVAARQGATDKLMLLAGPAIGGLLLLAISPASELFVLAGLMALAALVAVGLPDPSQLGLTTRAARRGDVSPGGPDEPRSRRGIEATGSVAIFLLVSGLAGFVYGTDTVLLNVLATDRLHLGTAGYGELFAGLGAGGLLVAPLVNRWVRRPGLAGLVLLGTVVYCLPSVLVAHTHSAALVVVLEAIRGAGSLAVDVAALTELQRIVLPQGLTALTARLTSVVFGSVAVGALCAPGLLLGLGGTATFTVLGLVPPVLVAAAYPALRRSDREITGRITELGPRIAVLEPLGLLQATSRPVLERLAADVTEVLIEPDEMVIREGDPADAFYVVLSGRLDVFVGDGLVNELGPGDWFGEIGLLEGMPRTATVRSVDSVLLYRIGGAAFLDAVTQLPPSPTLLDSVAARLATVPADRPVATVS